MATKTICFFISSTFNDMQAERDVIRKKLIPWLRNDLKDASVDIQITDLRWGVSTLYLDDEETRESKVLHVCMDAIHNSKPFFIALLGERYGWTPSAERINSFVKTLDERDASIIDDNGGPKSVTEMEILLGALGSNDLMDHGFFCFRKPDSYADMPLEKKKFFIDQQSDDEERRKNAHKLVSLRQRINQECEKTNTKNHIINYSATWNDEKDKFIGLESLIDKLHDSLLDKIREDIRADEEITTYTDSEQDKLRSFIDNHVNGFCGCEDYINKQIRFLTDACQMENVLNGKTGKFITGFSGCGKSSLLCKLYQQLQDAVADSPFYLLIHAAGISPKSTQSGEMIANWSRQMQEFLGDSPGRELYDVALFKTLLTRIRAKGLSPVILIDSLDSFGQDRDIVRFDFIPSNVPFICTSLPGYADDIVKRHPNFEIEEMRLFSDDDARQMIQSALENNKKELSPNIQEQLLSKRNSRKQPAYTSPLWLKLALSILMELGSEDFRAIHKINVKREDAKIEAYLSQTVSGFPADAEELFHHFIEISCRYFNPRITRESLAYIAIAQYGMREDFLEELFGDDWNPLEFNSLRFWLRDLIRCNNMDHRWFFTHAVLRNVMFSLDKQLTRDCRQRFIKQLFASTTSRVEDKEEVAYQLMSDNDIHTIHLIQQSYQGYFSKPFLAILKANKGQAMNFIKAYSNAYLADGDLIESIKNHLFNEGMSLSDDSLKQSVIEITDIQAAQFTDDILRKSADMVERYFKAFDCQSSIVSYNGDDEKYLEFFKPLQQTYYRMKQYYGDDIFTQGLYYSGYFNYWSRAIGSLKRISRYEDRYQSYLKNVEAFIDDWYSLCLEYQWPKDFCIMLKGLLGNGSELEVDDNIKMLQVAHEYLFNILEQMYNEGRLEMTDELTRLTDQLIGNYLMYYDDPAQVVPTPLMILMGYEEAQVSQVINGIKEARQQRWDAYADSGHAEATLTQVMDGELGEETIEEYHDYNDLDSSGNQDEEPELEGEELQHEIIKAEAELDQYIKDNGRELEGNDDTALDGLIRRCLRAVKLHIKAANHDQAVKLLKQSGVLAVSSIVRGSNYAISSDAHNIIDYCEMLGKVGCVKEQLQQARSIADALRHSYYHHPDGEMHRELYVYLLELYEKHDMLAEKVSFLEDIFDICCRAHTEVRYASLENTHRALSYLQDVYLELLNAFRESGMIKDAVMILERWIALCGQVYADNLDTGWAYDYIDKAYDHLAGLYDGTPALVEGMKERGSVFLKDPYIMVTQNGKWGYINHDGSVAIPLIYDGAWKAERDNLSVRKGDKWGYLDLKGNILMDAVRFNMDVAIPIRNHWGIICQGYNWAMLSVTDGCTEVAIDVDSFHGVSPGGMVKVRLQIPNRYLMDFLLNDGHTLLFNGKMDTVMTPNRGVIVAQYTDESSGDTFAALYDTHGRELSRPKRYSSIGAFGQQSLAPARTVDGHAGYLNHAGEEVTSFQYAETRPFSEGFGAVAVPGPKQSLRWGFVDEAGNEVIKPQYVSVGDFHEGLAWICVTKDPDLGFGFRGGKYGFINRQGKMVMQPLYDDVSSFYQGEAAAWVEDTFFYLTHSRAKATFVGVMKKFSDFLSDIWDKIQNKYYEFYYRLRLGYYSSWRFSYFWYRIKRRLRL